MTVQIGPHRVRSGNVMDSLDDLLGGQRVNYFYSDPPWGQGNLRFWQTMNTKMTGAAPLELDLAAFLNRIFEVATTYTLPEALIFIEYGVRWRSEIEARAQRYHLNLLGTATPVYSGKRYPLHLHVLSRQPRPLPADYLARIDGTTSLNTLRAALGPFPVSGAILDPCCGLGLTARIALERGLTFYGNEINGARLAKTIQVLQAGVA